MVTKILFVLAHRLYNLNVNIWQSRLLKISSFLHVKIIKLFGRGWKTQ
jgi:hypothetical protein